jgi:hypothetical protein
MSHPTYLLPIGTKIERLHEPFKRTVASYFEKFVTTKDARYDENEMHPSEYKKDWVIINLPSEAYPYIQIRVKRSDLLEITNRFCIRGYKK